MEQVTNEQIETEFSKYMKDVFANELPNNVKKVIKDSFCAGIVIGTMFTYKLVDEHSNGIAERIHNIVTNNEL